MAVIPCSENVLHEMPAMAPVDPTQTSLFFADAPTVLGNSPGTEIGVPTMVSLVGSVLSIANMERVFDPALTAKRF